MRQPAVAGTFYPFDREDLLRMIDRMIERATVRQYPTFGFVSPHAGYIYSGWTAAYGYKSAVNIEDLFPDHSWESHEQESAAACYHTLAARFIASMICSSYSPKLNPKVTKEPSILQKLS